MLNLSIFRRLSVFSNIASQLIYMRAGNPFAARNKGGAISEQLIHVFEIEASGLRLEGPEEDCISQVTDDEHDIKFLRSR